MFGGVLVPIGLFWFAWYVSTLCARFAISLEYRTTYPSIHYMVPIIGSVPFGMGMLLVFTGVVGYLMDTYQHFCASALAATVVLRSLLGAVFPLFTAGLFKRLGDQWGTSVFAFLALACTPLPLVFYVSLYDKYDGYMLICFRSLDHESGERQGLQVS